MDTAKLALFVKIAETENLTQAAREMGYTQSGASHIIRSLEQDLGGIKLFTRGREGSLLTSGTERPFQCKGDFILGKPDEKRDSKGGK